MTDDALLLVGRDAGDAHEVYERHADRLRQRMVAESVRVVTYTEDPQRQVRDALSTVPEGRTFAVPMCMAHTHETTDSLPAAFSTVDTEVQYCEPVGRSPSMTRAIVERAADCGSANPGTSLVLVGLGNSTGGYHREVTEYHAAHAREHTDYNEVVSCYLVQNPAVECVRYNISSESAVAVPLFVASNPATEEQIPTKLELGRGGISYADPLGPHPHVTEAIVDRFETRRVLADSTPSPSSFEAALAETARPLATDGDRTSL